MVALLAFPSDEEFFFSPLLGKNRSWKKWNYPPWNKQLAPENGWLEYDRFLLKWPIFRVYVSFRECKTPENSDRAHNKWTKSRPRPAYDSFRMALGVLFHQVYLASKVENHPNNETTRPSTELTISSLITWRHTLFKKAKRLMELIFAYLTDLTKHCQQIMENVRM